MVYVHGSLYTRKRFQVGGDQDVTRFEVDLPYMQDNGSAVAAAHLITAAAALPRSRRQPPHHLHRAAPVARHAHEIPPLAPSPSIATHWPRSGRRLLTGRPGGRDGMRGTRYGVGLFVFGPGVYVPWMIGFRAPRSGSTGQRFTTPAPRIGIRRGRPRVRGR